MKKKRNGPKRMKQRIKGSIAVSKALKKRGHTCKEILPFRRPGMPELFGRLEKTRKRAPRTSSAEAMIRKDREALSQ
jgi:hypothetical protein